MLTYVIDASVASKWYFQEELSDKAELLLQDDAYVRLAPDFIYVEVAAVAWKHVRRSEIDAVTAKDALAALRRRAFTLTPSTDLIAEALDLALQTSRSVYDCLYLALAIRSKCPLVTADRKFFATLRSGALAEHVIWVGDLH